MCSSIYKTIATIMYCVCCLILLGLAFTEIAFALFIPTVKYIGTIASVPTLLLASLVAMGLWMESTVLLSITIFLNIVTIACLGTAIGIGKRLEGQSLLKNVVLSIHVAALVVLLSGLLIHLAMMRISSRTTEEARPTGVESGDGKCMRPPDFRMPGDFRNINPPPPYEETLPPEYSSL